MGRGRVAKWAVPRSSRIPQGQLIRSRGRRRLGRLARPRGRVRRGANLHVRLEKHGKSGTNRRVTGASQRKRSGKHRIIPNRIGGIRASSSVRRPGDLGPTAETHGFASPPRDGYAFGERQRRRKFPDSWRAGRHRVDSAGAIAEQQKRKRRRDKVARAIRLAAEQHARYSRDRLRAARCKRVLGEFS